MGFQLKCADSWVQGQKSFLSMQKAKHQLLFVVTKIDVRIHLVSILHNRVAANGCVIELNHSKHAHAEEAKNEAAQTH